MFMLPGMQSQEGVNLHVEKGINEEKMKGSGKTLKQNMTSDQILQGFCFFLTTQAKEGKTF